MLKLTLINLRCIEPSDWNGADECRIEVFIDGFLQSPLSKTLRLQQIWDINQTFEFNKIAKIMLWEEDRLNPDDILGVISVEGKQTKSRVRQIKKGNGHYELTYNVTASPSIYGDPVQDAIQSFKGSNKPGLWKHVPKQALIDDIEKTINNPLNVNQANTPLCGPATIIYELASKFPQKYVEICQELFENGKYRTRTKEIVPSNLLVNSSVKSGISVSDWMLMATLRDTENEIFHVEASSNAFVMGFTTPWEMKGWTFELLGYTHAEYVPLYFYGELEALRKAKYLVKSGGVAFLMIHSALLTGEDLLISYPNHWVSIKEVRKISNVKNVELISYSWGKEYPIVVSLELFEKHTWGIVYGKP